jgi:hypothetical protein
LYQENGDPMKKKKRVILLSSLSIIFLYLIIFEHTFLFNAFSGQIRFPKEHVGADLIMEDGKKFKVFRRLQIKRKDHSIEEYAVFKVRFKFKNFNFKVNKALSMIPVPFLVGLEGFREKYWTFNENDNYFQGIYQWESKEIAEKYPDSFIFGLMTKRAATGTISYEIISNTDVSQYIQTLLL